MSMTFVVAPNTSGLTPLYPYESTPSQKFLPNPSRNKCFKRAPSESDCKSNTFLLHHQTFCKLFYRKNTPTTTNTMIYTLLSRYIFFLRYRISYNITLLYRRYLTSVWQTAVSGYLRIATGFGVCFREI